MKHKKNYFMFNPEEEEPRELTAEEKEKLIKLFNNRGHQVEAIKIAKIWLINQYETQMEIFDYINEFDYSNREKQLIFNMYLFLREYNAEITRNTKPDGMDELEELLFNLFEKGNNEFYEDIKGDEIIDYYDSDEKNIDEEEKMKEEIENYIKNEEK